MSSIARQKAALKTLQQRSLPKFLSRALGDWALIVLTVAAAGYVDSWWGYALAVILVGNRQHALAILGHDASHRLICRNRRSNNFIGNALIFWPLGATLSGYRSYHFKHHRYVGTEKDPERGVLVGFRYNQPNTPWRNTILFAGDLLGLGMTEFKHLQKSMAPERRRHVAEMLLFWGIALAILWPLDAVWILAIWWIAVLTSFWAFARIRTISEHTGADNTHRFEANHIARFLFFPHNTWCHYEHHNFPSIPCYNLPRLRAELNDEPVLTTQGLFDRLATVHN